MVNRMPMADFERKAGDTPFEREQYASQVIDATVRAVAEPDQPIDFPEWPKELYDSIKYWEGAVFLMTVLLGWSNPAKGLLWWYDQKKETFADAKLARLKELWDHREQLDLLAAWFWVTLHPSAMTDVNCFLRIRGVRRLSGIALAARP